MHKLSAIHEKYGTTLFTNPFFSRNKTCIAFLIEIYNFHKQLSLRTEPLHGFCFSDYHDLMQTIEAEYRQKLVREWEDNA